MGATALSTAIGAHGVGVTSIGGTNSVKSAKDLYQMFNSEGSSSPTPKKPSSQKPSKPNEKLPETKGMSNGAYRGYYERKEFRTKIYNAEYTPHGYKHLKAKTAEEAKRFSETGDKNAQYLPDVNNKEIEKEALTNGHIIDNGNNNYYFIYNAGKVIGYDNGVPTQWIRAELTNGNVYHGHPIAGAGLDKYLRKLGVK